MSWGTELWDQYDNIARHTDKGIEFCDFYSNFIKQRSDCELAYAKSLRKLIKNFTPKKKDEDLDFSLHKGFQRLLTEVGDLAGQHESISEKLTDEVAKDLMGLINEIRHDRKKHLLDGETHTKNLQASLSHLDRSKKTYERAYKQSCTAIENYQKADADLNLSRAEVERAKNVMHNKKQICEDCKSEYAKQLEATNSAQRDHYTKNIPTVFHSLQTMDEKRIRRLADYMKNSAELHSKVLPIVQKCLDGMITASNAIDPEKDSQIVIGRYKSGFQPPGDVPFEDLSNLRTSNTSITANNNVSSPNSQSNSQTSSLQNHDSQSVTASPQKTNTLSKIGTIGSRTKKDREKHRGISGIFPFSRPNKGEETEDFSHLPPTQRQKRLQTKIDALHSQIKKEAEERDAMTRMSELYTANPKLGDAAPLVNRLAENQKNLENLRGELSKYETYLLEVESQLSQLSNSNQDLTDARRQDGVVSDHLRHSTSDISQTSSSTGGGGESGRAGSGESGGASSTHSGNTDPGDHETSTPSTPQPPHHLDKKHRVAPKPPTEEQSGSQVSIPSVQVEAELENNHISGQDRVSEGSNSTNYELPPEPVLPVEAKLNEDFPEPPDYAPPPPPPDEEEFTWSAQDLDQTSSHSPESGYIGDPGYQEDDLPTICRCRSLYGFQADNAGTISMIEGEELEVVEEDQGDGWTRVRRHAPRGDCDDGFVPTSYLELNI